MCFGNPFIWATNCSRMHYFCLYQIACYGGTMWSGTHKHIVFLICVRSAASSVLATAEDHEGSHGTRLFRIAFWCESALNQGILVKCSISNSSPSEGVFSLAKFGTLKTFPGSCGEARLKDQVQTEVCKRSDTMMWREFRYVKWLPCVNILHCISHEFLLVRAGQIPTH